MDPPPPARAASVEIQAMSRLSTLKPSSFQPAQMKLGIRATVAALVAYALAYGLDLPNGYWAVLSAILVVQSSIGASLSAAMDRVLGTVAGGIVGVAAAVLAGSSVPLGFALLTLSVFLTSTLAARYPSYKLAPITVVVVMLANPTHVEPWISGIHRVLEIGLGGIVGVAAALFILPARALFYLFPHCASALRLCARLLERGRDGLLGRGLDPAEIDTLNAKARLALRAADSRVAEAEAERRGRLASHPDVTPVVRSCRRLWHSVIILLRSADHPLPEPLAALFAPRLDAAVAALSGFMGALAIRLDGDAGVDLATPAQAAQIAVAALEAEAERLNAAGAFDDASGAALAGLFAAVSTCSQAVENLNDLAARLKEMRVEEP